MRTLASTLAPSFAVPRWIVFYALIAAYWMGADVTVAEASKGRVRAFGRVWDFAGRSAEICQINWSGPR